MRESPSTICAVSLTILTIWNMLLGGLMIAEKISVESGMIVSFAGMIAIVFASWKVLMGDERPWESPKQYKSRKSK